MDPSNSYLGKMLLEEITPVVMVLRTPLVEESCRKNGFNLVQMLHPFSFFNNIDVPVRTASDQPYRLHKFRLRLHYPADIRQPNVEVAEGRLKQVVTKASENDITDLHLDPPQLEDLLIKAESESLPSWFRIFNKELIRTSSFSEHEAFDHPVACLVVVSSRDEEPINKFVDLFNTNQLPPLFNDGAMDPKIVKYYLLIHDNQDDISDKATNILTEMKGTFGPNDCGLLCINSSQDGLGNLQENPWARLKVEALLGEDIGCFLNNDDLNEMKDLMQDLSSKHIIPHMEQKIRELNQQVSATRKGFRNQIRNLWWRKGKEDIPEAPSSNMYTFSSNESQIRVLGDYAFMLRDYELALSNYRLLSTDYKIDKAWKRYAGAQEMMGLAYFMLDQSRKDAEYCMENAFTQYLKLGSSGHRNATRCGLWWTEMLKTRDQYKEAAGVYFRISNEEPSLHAAVMLEQSSYCYLLSDPPMLRKYGFHLVLAGSRYYISDQKKHALRAYRNALSVYKGNAWNYINDHVHFHIGKWYAFLEIFDIAIKHMLEVLACGHQSVVTQELFLRDFLQVVQKLGKTFEVFRLQLPVINMPSVKVIFEDQRTYASSAAVNVEEILWQTLEEDLVPSIPMMRTNWLDSQPKLSKRYKDSNICIAGEVIKVDIEFRNPLKIPLSVSGVSLICQLSEKAEALESEAVDQNVNDVAESLSTTGLHSDLEFKKLKSCWELNGSNSSFVVTEVDFSLKGRETSMVQLMVTPNVEGILNIVGVRWKLSDSVVGYHSFDSNLEKKKNVKRRRRPQKSPKSNLKFTVIKTSPRLEGCIQHIPNKAYAGELRRLILELRNPSEFPVKNLKMKINHPRFLIPGCRDDIETDFPACLGKQTKHEQSIVQANTVQGSNEFLFSFPEDVLIQGDTTFSWPLWLRAGVSGSLSFYISLYYEMENSSSDMRYRTLRMCYNLEVLPSLDISFRISPCPSRLREFLVHMDIMNRTSLQSFQLHQLSSVGYQWEISSLPPDDIVCPSSLLNAGEAVSCFFKIKNPSKSSNEGKSSLSNLTGSDVQLDSCGSNKFLFDTSRTPLKDFHQHERKHQGKSVEGNSRTVDFLLISQPQENIEGPSDSARLFSHHVCHCSVASTSPVWWIMDGPRTVKHDFSTFLELRFRMIIHNSSNSVASIRLDTFDPTTSTGRLSDASALPQSPSASSSANQEGWHDVSLVTELKVTTDVFTPRTTKSSYPDGVTPFIWSASSSTRVVLGPMSSTEVPLQICLFAPGIYNLSNYTLQWSLTDKERSDDEMKETSGTSSGHPYYLTVLQSP